MGTCNRYIQARTMMAASIIMSVAMLCISQTMGAESRLDKTCPVEWQRITLEDAVSQLAGKFEIPYRIDSSVSSQTRQTIIRLSADYLSGRQIMRWLGRLAGVGVIVDDGAILIVADNLLPVAWRGLPEEDKHRDKDKVIAQWPKIMRKQSSVSWIDAPLRIVAKDISTLFEIDTIFHLKLYESQPLIHLEAPAVSLEEVCNVLTRQIGGEMTLLDGAIWIKLQSEGSFQGERMITTRASSVSRPALEIFQGVESFPKVETIEHSSGLLDGPMSSWSALEDRIGSMVRLSCQVMVPPGVSPPDWEVRGSVWDVLDAAQMLGLLRYELGEKTGDNSVPRLLIQVRPPDR